MNKFWKIVLILIVISVISAFHYKTFSFGPSIPAMIGKKLFEDEVKEIYATERLKRMSVSEGTQCINEAVNQAIEKQNQEHKKRQNILIKNFDKKYAGKDILNPDKETKAAIDKLNWEMEYIDEIRIKKIQKFENYREDLINYFKPYWYEYMKKKKLNTY